MLRIRAKLLGTGTDGDPYRVDLPTYSLVEHDPARGVALVDVPEADVPDVLGLPLALVFTGRLTDAARPALGAALKAAWYAHLDRRYAATPRPFRPDRA